MTRLPRTWRPPVASAFGSSAEGLPWPTVRTYVSEPKRGDRHVDQELPEVVASWPATSKFYV